MVGKGALGREFQADVSVQPVGSGELIVLECVGLLNHFDLASCTNSEQQRLKISAYV